MSKRYAFISMLFICIWKPRIFHVKWCLIVFAVLAFYINNAAPEYFMPNKVDVEEVKIAFDINYEFPIF